MPKSPRFRIRLHSARSQLHICVPTTSDTYYSYKDECFQPTRNLTAHKTYLTTHSYTERLSPMLPQHTSVRFSYGTRTLCTGRFYYRPHATFCSSAEGTDGRTDRPTALGTRKLVTDDFSCRTATYIYSCMLSAVRTSHPSSAGHTVEHGLCVRSQPC